MNRIPWLFLLLAFLGSFSLNSCRKTSFANKADDILSFSTDTLKFDTVFTARGSATRFFKIYNPHNKWLKVDKIMLGGGASSPFRLNIDGFSTPVVNDIEIAPEDSLYIYAEVTIDPDDLDNPFIVQDSVWFETNGNTQKVMLEAFGQNANYIGRSNEVYALGCSESIWNDPKPYVVLGFLLIDSCDLIIQEGTEVHFQGGISYTGDGIPVPSGVLFVTPNAHLEVNGTLNNPVYFQSDRIEPEFENSAGQWGGIWLFEGSTGNKIHHARIQHAIVGIRVDSSSTLDIDNTWVYQMASSGIVARHAEINAENLLVFNAGSYHLQLEHGGNYNFDHCTFTFSNQTGISHEDPILRISNYWIFEDAIGNRTILENDANVNFNNCIIYGPKPEEIVLDAPEIVNASINHNFNHCLIRVDTLNTSTFINPVINEDPLFRDPFELDYHLDTIISPAVDAGAILASPVILDLDGNPRVNAPDIGCYEFQE